MNSFFLIQFKFFDIFFFFKNRIEVQQSSSIHVRNVEKFRPFLITYSIIAAVVLIPLAICSNLITVDTILTSIYSAILFVLAISSMIGSSIAGLSLLKMIRECSFSEQALYQKYMRKV